MNVTLWLLLGELLLVLVIVLITSAFATWRNRRRLIAELANLSARVSRTETERQSTLQQRLREYLGLEVDAAERLSRELVRAEKTLFKAFIEVQFNADAIRIGAFDQNVYALLDSYWHAAAIKSSTARSNAAKQTLPESGLEFVETFTVERDADIFADSLELVPVQAEEPAEYIVHIGTSDTEDELSDPAWDNAFAEAVRKQTQLQ
jgi:hypothetical protein